MQITTLTLLLFSSTSSVLALAAPAPAANADTCPDGSTPGTTNGRSICCPGILNFHGNGEDDGACLVGCTLEQPPCFPFCSGSTPNDLTTSGTCTTVPITASDYTSRVYSGASGGGAAAVTGAASASASMSTEASTITTTDSSGSTVTSATTATTSMAQATQSSSSQGAAAPMMTAAPVLVLGYLAAAVLV